VPLPEGSPCVGLGEVAGRLWSALDGFAEVTSTEWATLSYGEGARLESGAGLTADRVRAVCAGLGDATRLDADLGLRCVAVDGSEVLIDDGGWLLLDLDWPDPGARGEGEPTLTLSMQLNVDIYAPQSGSPDGGWGVLHSLNAPRLAAFLRRVRSELGAELTGRDAYAGPGTIDADGWRAP
jgi:hypothetical protein